MIHVDTLPQEVKEIDMKMVFQTGVFAISLTMAASALSAEQLSPADQKIADRYHGDEHACLTEGLQTRDGPHCVTWQKTQAEVKARNICFMYDSISYREGFYCGTSPIPTDLKPGFTMDIARGYFESLTMDGRKHYQREMRNLGYYKGAIDGKFGPGTSSGIRQALEVEAALRDEKLENIYLTNALIESFMFDALNQFGD